MFATAGLHRVIRSLLFIVSIPLVAETVRDRASTRFSFIPWSVDPQAVPARAIPAQTLPGGNESFAVISPKGDSGLPAIYPSIGGIGVLDYTGVEDSLLSALSKASESLGSRAIPAELCAPNRAFLPIVMGYRLNKLPAPKAVFFSRPRFELDRPEGDGRGANRAVVPYGLMYQDSGGRSSVVIEITFALEGELWKIDELRIDGESYAAATRKD
jgi:hypothetical protein